MSTIHRHFGTIRGGEEVVIAGYNKGTNACLIIRITHLPQDEAADLRRIAMSAAAQNLDYLIPTLRVELHKSHQDWFTHLASRLYRNDGSVANIPLKELETMNQEQKNFFKGFGNAVEPTGGPSSRVGATTEFTTPIADENETIVASPVLQATTAPANLEQARAAGLISPTPQNDPEMARVAAQAAPGNGQIDALAAAMTSLAESQAKQAEAMVTMASKMKAPAPRRKATTTRKKAASA